MNLTTEEVKRIKARLDDLKYQADMINNQAIAALVKDIRNIIEDAGLSDFKCFMAHRDKIKAIKSLRDLVDTDLRTAKEIVEVFLNVG